MTAMKAPPDAQARRRALALDASFVVRAPAGSGKTELLTRRFLRLLATVDEPEEILAITFTRAATAEMRNRVLRELEKAARAERVHDAGHQDDESLTLARAALAHSDERGWRLLEQPHRLNIETIDSLCLRIAHNQPLLSRMGGRLAPSEHAWPLYAEAARRALGQLGSADAELDAALAHLLELRDNNLPDCENLIAGMLMRRDQWIRTFPLIGNARDDEWAEARSKLERPFRDEVKRVHTEAYRLMMREPTLADVLMELAQYACENGYEKMAALAGIQALPRPEATAVAHWRCIAHFLLTNGAWRKPSGINVTVGFPPNGRRQKDRMKFLLERLPEIAGLREMLCAVQDLPEPRYEERQWATLRHIFMVLRQAVAELRVLFAERNTVDFVELNLAAQDVLRNSDTDALLAVSGNIRHLLVDEFQDTSRSQHELLRLLIRAWEADDSRTCFLVGDPMQSVYLFRQAEVELFEHVAKKGLASDEHTVDFERLELLANFRSHEGLTARWNEMFSAVFGANRNGNGAARVEYSPTIAAIPALAGEAVQVYPQVLSSKATQEERALAQQHEAEQVLAIIAEHAERMDHARQEGREYRVAVLGRARPHLAQIAALLRKRDVPFRAVELERLSERQEMIDLLSLTRALLHPMDRVAWLAALRAPWCGLTLDDLHVLAGTDDPAFRHSTVLEWIAQRLPLLTSDGAARLHRVIAILQQALAARFEGLHAMSFSQWIERTWRSLGGPECLDAAAYENAQVFFTLLDEVSPDGMACLTEDFESEMEQLFAQPDPQVSERAGVQLMTIHKAKGLGFHVVIVPGLDRKPRSDDSPLICSVERTDSAGETEMLVAPIGYRGDDKHPTYAWVMKQRSVRADEELKRLLYVACTRAQESLHLLGTATSPAESSANPEKQERRKLKPGDAKSLLATAWPALEVEFEAAWIAQQKEFEQQPGGNVIAFPAPRDAEPVFEMAAAAQSETQPALLLRRLPSNTDLTPALQNVAFASANAGETEPPLERPHGSRDARQKGNVVHALLERLTRGAAMESLSVAARALLRAAGYAGKALDVATAEVLAAVHNCAADPDGAWILSPHAQARSETSWTGWNDGAMETLRPDRVFIAGGEPRAAAEDHLWIIDYKMSAPAGDAEFLTHQREIYAPQLARYARALREAEGITLPVRFGLYYPRFALGIAQLDWWAEEDS